MSSIMMMIIIIMTMMMITYVMMIIMVIIIGFRMIALVGQKLLAAAVIVGLSLGFGFLPAALAKKYFRPTFTKSI